MQNDWVVIRYDDKLPYQERMISCLEQVEEEIILFHHEDMFLYGPPDEEKIRELTGLVDRQELDIIKLSRASYNDNHPLVNNTTHADVYENPLDLKFAIQPSICRKEKLEEVYSKTSGNNIWEFEKNSSAVCHYFNIKTGMVWRKQDQKRGQ